MPTQPTVLRSSLVTVLTLVQAQISTITGIPLNRVRIVARSKPVPLTDAPQDILVRDRGFTADDGNSDRHDCRLKRRIGITIRTRSELSEVSDDAAWMMSQTEGNVIAEEAVINALQNFFPEDANSNIVTYEPLKVLSGNPRTREADGWGEVELMFHLGYEVILDQSWA